jgi:dipeptidyl aminopeptidase/acylaminoacyl peptidase
VFVDAWSDREHDARYSNLRLVSSDGKQQRAYTEGAWRDWSPRWSPDNKRVAWLSRREGKTQIYVRRMDRAESRRVPTEQEPLAMAWSPDGNALAFTARVGAKRAAPAWAPPSIAPLIQQALPSVQVFVTPVEGGEARQIGHSDLDFQGEPAWMPNGQSIVCAERGGEIFALRLGDGVVKELTRTGDVNRDPAPSPDGTKIAYTSASGKPQSYAVRRLMVMNADGTRERIIGGTLDRDARDPQWSNDSRTVYFVADDHGATQVYAGRNDGTARQVTTRAERIRSFALADNGRAVVARSTGTEGAGVYTFAVDVPAGGWTLADVNERMMAERQWGAAEELRYESSGNTVQAWLVKPPQFDATKKYPLIVDIQDAPRRMYGVEFQLRAQILAARGFVVLCANPRGTPGYGEAFGNLLATRFPGDDADDLLRGVDAAIAQGYIDAKRVMVTGGLVAAWLIGHSDRFARAVAVRPVVDWSVDVATAPDGAARARNWLRAMPWDDAELYTKRSPIFAAGNFKTPTLVIACEHDPEADELYFALGQRKVESALVRLTDKPAARVQELEAILGWLLQ